jgi:DNA-binding GntR family transcriptional regulator
VTSFDISTLRDFLESISLLYRLTARLAAINRRSEHLARIAQINIAHSKAIAADDVDGVVEANRQFHLAVAEAAGNGIYLTWVRNLLDHGERILRLYLRQYDDHVVAPAMEGHRAMVEAIVAQNPDAAEAAGALDAQIIAEGLSKFFLRRGAADFQLSTAPVAEAASR